MVALAIYLLALVAASGTFGVFIQQLLADHGFSPGYHSSLMLAIGAGTAYAMVQMAYVGLLRLLRPGKHGPVLLAEALGQLAVLVLVPRLMHSQVDWPHPVLIKVEPLLYLAVFLVLHALLKLFSLFTSLQTAPASPLPAFAWVLAAVLMAAVSHRFLNEWLVEQDLARPRAPVEAKPCSSGDQYSEARLIPEGSVVECALAPYPGQCLTLYWANAPMPDTAEHLGRIFVTATIHGEETRVHTDSIRIQEAGWATMRIPADAIPEAAESCEIVWTSEKTPSWMAALGLQPVVKSDRNMLLSGPHNHIQQPGEEDEGEPSFVVIALEGLACAHLASGKDRNPTPNLQKFFYSSLAFPNAFTPAPEAPAACMSMLSGLSPLRHGYLQAHQGPLPPQFSRITDVLEAKHYATAAFTEGDEAGDLTFGSGFEDGFVIFDPSYRSDEDSRTRQRAALPTESGDDAPRSSQPAGSRITLEHARAWLDQHADVRFLAFIRLRELCDLTLRERYGTPFAEKGEEPTSRDVFDTALAYLDRQLGMFLAHLRESDVHRNTVIVFTSPYGIAFASGGEGLAPPPFSEEALRVPVMIAGRSLPKTQRDDLISLEDIAPAILSLADARFAALVDGQDFMSGPNGSQPISMFGDPLVVTMRSSHWRLFWNTGRRSFSDLPPETPGEARLFDVVYSRKRGWDRDVARHHADLVNRWKSRIETQLDLHEQLWQGAD